MVSGGVCALQWPLQGLKHVPLPEPRRRLFTGRLAAGTPRLNPFPTASPPFLSPPLCCPLGLPLCVLALPRPLPPSLPPSILPAIAPSWPLRWPLPPAVAVSSPCCCPAHSIPSPGVPASCFRAGFSSLGVCFPCFPGPAPPGRCSGPPVCTLCVWCCVYGILGLLAPVHRCARSVCGVACTASWASWLLFTAVHALCAVLRARFPGPPGSCSPTCTLCVWCCGCGVLGCLVPVPRRARSLCVVACAVSWAAWLLFTGVPDCVLRSVYGCKSSCHSCPALHCRAGPLAPRDNHFLAEGHWFLQSTALPMVSSASERCVVCTVSWAPWLRFTGVHALCAVLYVRRPGPPGSCLPVRVLAVCSTHASHHPPSSSLVLVHALRDCPPAFFCCRLLVLVAPLAFAFESPSVLVRSFGLSLSSFPWLVSSLSSLPTSPCSCLSFPPSCPLRSGPSGPGSMCPCACVPIRLPIFSFSPLALSPPALRLLSFLSSPFCSLLLFLFSSPCRSAAVIFSLFAAPDLPFPGRFVPGRSSPGAPRPRMFQFAAPGAPPDVLPYSLCCPGRSSPWHWVHPRTIQSGGSGRASFRTGCSNPGRLFVLFFLLPRTLHPMAPGSPPDDAVRGLVSCFVPSRMLHSGAPSNLILSFALDAPVRSTGFSPGRSSPGARVVLHSAPDAPLLGVFLSYSLRCLGNSSPWHRVHPRTIQPGGVCRASFRTGCSIPSRLFIVFSPLPRTLQSVAPGSPPDDPVWGLVSSFVPSRMLHSGAPFNLILSFALDAPVRSTGFSPGRSSPGARVVLHSAPDAPLLGVFVSYSLRCLGRSSPWRRVHPRTIQPRGVCRASSRPGCSIPSRLFIVFSPLPRTLQSVAPGSPPDDPVRGLLPCFWPPRWLQSGVSLYRILSIAPDAPVRGTGFTPGRSSPGASAVPLSVPGAPVLAVSLSYSLRCLRRSSPGHWVLPRTMQSGG